MLLKVKFKKGGIGHVHQHFHSQTSYVKSGVFEIEINENKKILRAGDGFYIDPDDYHSAVCIEEEVLIVAFNPMRIDFWGNRQK